MTFQSLGLPTSKSGTSPLPGLLGGVGQPTPQPLLQVILPGAGLCGGPTSPGIWSHSRALGETGPGVLPTEAKEFCTLPQPGSGRKFASHLSAPIPHFPIPPQEPGLPESNSQEGRGWPVYIQPHRSGDGELREDNLILKISFT